jgi:hypothetical protein
MKPFVEICIGGFLLTFFVLAAFVVLYQSGFISPDINTLRISTIYGLYGNRRRQFNKLVFNMESVVDDSLNESVSHGSNSLKFYAKAAEAEIMNMIWDNSLDLVVQNAAVQYYREVLHPVLNRYQ